MDISIIIINWNTRQLLLDCIDSVFRTVQHAKFEIFVVDNGSCDGSVEAVQSAFPSVKVIANPRNQGFAKANNIALRQMQGRYAVLLNSDTVLKKSSLETMLDFMDRHPEAGMCGPQLLNRDGSKQVSTGSFPTLLNEFASKAVVRFLSKGHLLKVRQTDSDGSTAPHQVEFIIGACMMVRKTALDQAGLLDEDFFFLYEEIEWCQRMHKSGWPVYHLPAVEIFHYQKMSFTGINLKARAESWRSRYIYFRKSLDLPGFSYAFLLITGGMLTVFHFIEYSLLNSLTFFTQRNLRSRWYMFGYLLVWHVRGLPDSMCLPR
jgi:GT2 family glycosyltransferase